MLATEQDQDVTFGHDRSALEKAPRMSRRAFLCGTSILSIMAITGYTGLGLIVRDRWVLRSEDV